MKAFPRKDAVEIDDKGRHLPQLGMDLRDYFAAKAMQSYLMTRVNNEKVFSQLEYAKESYRMADVMMEARNGNNE